MKRIKKGLAFFLATWIWMLALPIGTLSAMENTAEFLGGDGTEESPYLISNKTHLNNVRNHLDAHFLMVADIEFNEADFAQGGELYNGGQGWEPIGIFSGVFDGNGYTVKHLFINRKYHGTTGWINVGLFSYNKGIIENLGMVESSITASCNVGIWSGGIAGNNVGTIQNCYNTGSVLSDSNATSYVGGITGHNEGMVIQCHNSGHIDSNVSTRSSNIVSASGGIAGYNFNVVTDCYNLGEISSSAEYSESYAGGIVGIHMQGSIDDCHNKGNVYAKDGIPSSTGYESCAGGIAGYISYNKSIIFDCYNTGEITANSYFNAYAGGIMGNNDSNKSIIVRCYNAGCITAVNRSNSNSFRYALAGGITGENSGAITDCYNTGEITANSYFNAYHSVPLAGGIAGSNRKSINNCYNVGVIMGDRNLGGITGSNSYGLISNCYYLDSVESGTASGQDTTVCCTDEQMRQQGTFMGFDFQGIWKMYASDENFYPQLRAPFKSIGIEILSHPGSIQVIEGLQPNLFGITVKLTNDDGEEFAIPATTEMLLEFNPYETGIQKINLIYGGQTTAETIDIEVIPKSIVSIAVTTPPTKTTYVQGQQLNPAGGELTIYYNNNTSEKVDLSEAQLSYTADQPGETTATAAYQGFEASFAITVTERVIKFFSLIEPEKLSYVEGQELDVTGGKLQITFVSEDNYTERVPLEPDMISGYVPEQLGIQKLTVTYGEKTTTFVVNVVAKSLDSIAITTLPVKTEYLEGKDMLDLAGGRLTLTYNNGTSEEVDLILAAVSGFDNSNVGKQALTVTYQGKTTTLEVTVRAKSLTEIRVTKQPAKQTYLEGETFEPAGMEITAYYDNGTSEAVTDYALSGYDSAPGSKIITVTYGGKTATFEVTVRAKTLTEIRVTKQPAKRTYLEGDAFDPTGMEITAYYDNGTSEVVTDYGIGGYDSAPGSKIITVTYGGKTATFEVTVRAKTLTEIRVTKQPAKRTYLEGDAFDPAGMEITAYYDNGTSEAVTDYAISGYDSTPGIKRLTVTYGGKTVALEVTVRAKALVSIAVTKNPDQMTYVEGTALDTTGMELTLTFDNGTKEVLATGWTETYDFSQPGRQEVRIDCRGKTTTLTVMVLSKTLTGIAVSRLPNKLTYIEGNAFSAAGMEITAYYDNNTSEIVTDRVTIQGYDSAPGIKTMAISYQGKEASFTVTVEAKKPVSIAWKAKPNKTVYFVGEELSLSGAVILIRYNNGTTAEQQLEGSWGADQYNPNQIGTQTIYIRYQETPPISFTVTVKSRVPSSITSGTYSVGGGFLSKVGAGTTAAQLLGGINEKDYCKVYKGNTEVTGNALVGTGMVVKLLDGGTVKQTAAVVVTGDTNGDGQITITDMLAVKAHVLKKSALAGTAAKAADTSGDKVISITDFIQIKAHILGKDKIQPRAC